MSVIKEYLTKYKHLIADYFVIRQSHGRVVFYYATAHSPGEFVGNYDLIARMADSDTEIYNLNPAEFAKMRATLGV